MVPDSVVLPLTEITSPVHSNSIPYYLISLKIIFDFNKDTIPSFYVGKILCVFLLQILDYLSCVVLFHSPAPVKLASNYLGLIQTKNLIFPRSQQI